MTAMAHLFTRVLVRSLDGYAPTSAFALNELRVARAFEEAELAVLTHSRLSPTVVCSIHWRARSVGMARSPRAPDAAAWTGFTRHPTAVPAAGR